MRIRKNPLDHFKLFYELSLAFANAKGGYNCLFEQGVFSLLLT